MFFSTEIITWGPVPLPSISTPFLPSIFYFIEELAFILKVRGISDVYISTIKDMILFNSSYEFNKSFDIRHDKCITRKENYKPISHEHKH